MNQAWNKDKLKHKAPNVLKLIKRFNMVASWVITCIVTEPRLKKRGQLMAHFLKIAIVCFHFFFDQFLLFSANFANSKLYFFSLNRICTTWITSIPPSLCSLRSLMPLSTDLNGREQRYPRSYGRYVLAFWDSKHWFLSSFFPFQKYAAIQAKLSGKHYDNYRVILHSVNPPVLPYLYVATTFSLNSSNLILTYHSNKKRCLSVGSNLCRRWQSQLHWVFDKLQEEGTHLWGSERDTAVSTEGLHLQDRSHHRVTVDPPCLWGRWRKDLGTLYGSRTSKRREVWSALMTLAATLVLQTNNCILFVILLSCLTTVANKNKATVPLPRI